jgi:hypothetical protein
MPNDVDSLDLSSRPFIAVAIGAAAAGALLGGPCTAYRAPDAVFAFPIEPSSPRARVPVPPSLLSAVETLPIGPCTLRLARASSASTSFAVGT